MAIVLTDATNGSATLRVTAVAGSATASDLGLLGTGSGATLTGTRISDGASDIVVTLTNLTKVYIDLTGAFTLADVFAAFHSADTRLTATLSEFGNAIVVPTSSTTSTRSPSRR